MKTKLILLCCLFLGILNATSIQTNKSLYQPEESIYISYEGMSGGPKDWFAIYPAGSSNDWANVISWNYVNDGVTTGGETFLGLDAGNYEVRAFFKNSYNVEATSTFSVHAQTTVKTQHKILTTNENIWVEVNNTIGDLKDWVAIYPVGSSNDWANVIQWKFLNGKKNIEVKFDPLPAGEYDARVFFKNSYNLEANYFFKISTVSLPMDAVLSTKEIVKISYFTGFQRNRNDWVGIYKKGTDNSWNNVLAWQWIDNAIANHTLYFSKLPVGEYEARGFFNNSYKTEVVKTFKVIDLTSTENELLQQAKRHCLGDDNSTTSVLCANDLNYVYILTKKELNLTKYFKHYKIRLNENSVSLIDETIVPPAYLEGGLNHQYFHPKINNSSIYIITNSIFAADPKGIHNFYSKEGTKILSLSWNDGDGILDDSTMKTLDNGAKFYLERTFRDSEKRYKETYDISNPETMTLLNRVIVPIPR